MIGFLASRFLKASSSDRYHGRSAGNGARSPSYAYETRPAYSYAEGVEGSGPVPENTVPRGSD